MKEEGAEAIKFFSYYDIDSDKEINEKRSIVERLGSECLAEENMPLFVEIVTYSEEEMDKKEYAKVKPKSYRLDERVFKSEI